MHYSIHLGRSRSSARRQPPLVTLDLQQHAAIFCQNKELFVGYPEANGMSNYYGEAIYLGDEIRELRDELIALEKVFNGNDEVHPTLVRLLAVAERAIAKGLDIYCFSGC
ncbi:hypothetical protein [Marinobacterium arenosum]|uniref:hypothetical protein n=1 Tax=Marinobacterium arenosum TaxID=2862496 RepID=UPI001C98A974|nr:hypothetical protein [Marinobacterium arenosum]MBY4679133.1 hypothetical protein [Marinobacterium arenosum]